MFFAPRFTSLSLIAIPLAALALALSACSDSAPTEPVVNPLAGLAETTRGDSATTPPPTTPSTPGQFVGTVRGYTPGPPGTDTSQTAVLLAGVKVSAYLRTEVNGTVTAGSQVATTTTDANGYFVLDALPGAEYVVTFVPPQGTPYRGAWTVALAWEGSGNSPWYIMLPRS